MTIIWAALGTGAVYALIALGYNITLIAANVLNFAFANIVILAAFVAIWAITVLHVPFYLVLLGGALVGAIFSFAEERFAIRPLAGAGTHSELVTTVGAATIVTGLSVVVFGSNAQRVPILDGSAFAFLGGKVQWVDLVLVVSAIVLGVVLFLGFTKTRIGLASLARAENMEAAVLRGVNVRALSLVAFIIAGVIAGLLAPLIGAKTLASGSVPLVLAIKGFIALTLGGVGNQAGAVVGGLLIGLIEVSTQYFLGVNWGNLAVFVVFIAVLLVRPSGIFGRTQGRLV